MFGARMKLRRGVLARSAAVAIGLGIPAFLAHNLLLQRGQELAEAEQRVANTARALEHHAARTIEVTDAYLRAVAALLGPRATDLRPESLHSALREHFSRSRGLSNIVVIDRDGKSIVEAASFPTRPLNVSDRDYFKALRDRPGDSLAIGRPLVGSLTGKLVLPIARRIEGPDGAFAGLVQAVLDAEAFQAVYDAIDNGPTALLNLWRTDGTLLVRSPHVPDLIGRNFASSENYQRFALKRDSKPFWSPGATDGVERVIAFGFLDGYPLYVGASLARDAVLAPWRQSALTQGALGGGLTLVLVVALLLLGREIDRREATDMLIRASEVRHRLLAENATDIIIWCDLDTTRRYVSPAVTAVLGYAPDQLIGSRPLDFVHPDDAAGYAFTLADLTAGRVERTRTCQRYRHVDGTWIWLEISFSLTHDAVTGRADGYVATLRDITQRKAMEDALRESDARYRSVAEAQLQEARALADFTTATSAAILAQLAEGVIVTDAAGRITLVNKAAADIHGVARLDVEPDAYSDTYHLFTEDGRPHPPCDLPLARAVGGQIVRDARWRVRRTDGTEVVAIGNAQPLLGHDGAQIGAVLTVRDDTARDAAEMALRDLNATLAQRVAERTHEAETARVLAEAASHAKSEFLASMSHEIRTPLNGVIGYADLLCEEPNLGLRARQHAERIRTAGAALLTVVNDVLDFSKLEAGQVEIVPQPLAPVALIDNTVSIVRGSAEAKGLTLAVSFDPTVPAWLLGDEDRLRQVLLNLLNNAVKFTARGRIDLNVAVDAMSEDAVRMRCSIRDTGIGIPADKRNRLFQRFSQVDGSIGRDYGGSGLGLAISKALVERMGGAIGVESEVGRGSTFWFAIDLPMASEPTIAEQPPSIAGNRLGRRLLLAEDVPLNQDLARAILERAGHRVDVVADGASAVAAVQANAYDLVLMDVQMPGMDGMSATRRIRALNGVVARVPIVAMTANVLPEQVAEFRAAGMDDHVGKPFRQEALLSTIDRWVPGGTGKTPTPGIDHSVYDGMQTMVGHERMVDLLAMLADELTSRFGPSSLTHDRDQVAGDAHAMISAASMIGFASLAALCRDVEMVCRSADDYQPLFEVLRARSSETIAEIAALRAA
ncbi:PAS domain S-box protein [Methylobacterium pseudosasicola]|uniref:histidine kinase n=1 Tax=Methylobacterium pseudosasicola TaxID=582667 RepID=A0A1I4UF88_9HYPH|nr:PAS domain S-box protein [Methylobacterium pseudosasicola]SFM87674.1 PAS domain S-box-containing protein [Methylobacterium pseudosasicola]